jgi:heat shock protein HtpX
MPFNRLRAFALLALPAVVLVALGGVLGGQVGVLVGLLSGGLVAVAAYRWSDGFVLWMHGAQEVSSADAPELAEIVRNLAGRARLPAPRVYVVPEPAPNAFAIGRHVEHAAVVVSDGLLQLVTRAELEAVIAHELAHIRSRDTLPTAVVAAFLGVIGLLGGRRRARSGSGTGRGQVRQVHRFAAAVSGVAAPLATFLIHAVLPGEREFRADEVGARLAGSPEALASALAKLEAAGRRAGLADPWPASAQLFIVNPGRDGGASRRLSTHPPTEVRVARLRAMASVSGVCGGPW